MRHDGCGQTGEPPEYCITAEPGADLGGDQRNEEVGNDEEEQPLQWVMRAGLQSSCLGMIGSAIGSLDDSP